MPEFSVGVVSVVFAVFLALATLFGYWLRRIGKWYKREEGPKDRIAVGVTFMAVVGFVAGSLAQPAWEQTESCRASGSTIVKCLLPVRS